MRRSLGVVAALLLTAGWLVREGLATNATAEVDRPNYTKLEDGLFIGGLVAEPPPGVKSVLNLCHNEDPYQAKNHRWDPIDDTEPGPDLDWLKKQVEWVRERRKAGDGVYVHCLAGISRSAMVTTAYLMADRGWSRDKALEFIREKRPWVNPNPAFMKLLAEYETSLRAKKR